MVKAPDASKLAQNRKRKEERRNKKRDKPKDAKNNSTPRTRGGTGPNTGAIYYFSNRTMAADCKVDKQRIHDECDSLDAAGKSKDAFDSAKLNPEHAKNKTLAAMQRRMKEAVAAVDHIGKAESGYKKKTKNRWMENHCKGLWNKPGGDTPGDETDPVTGKKKGVPNVDKFKKQVEDHLNKQIAEYENVAKGAMDKLQKFAGDYMKDHLKDTMGAAAEKAAKRAALSRFPTLMAIVGRVSFYEGLGKLLGNVAGAVLTGDMENQFNAIEKAVTDALGKVEELKKLASRGGMEDAVASTQAAIAYANPCIKARKCLLVPYKKTGSVDGDGCCPGQTGHHVLPGAMFNKFEKKDGKYEVKKDAKGNDAKRDCWGKYNHNDALTMCLEGTTNRATNGSHGLAHAGTAALLVKDRESPDMDYTNARNKMSKMMAKEFGCDEECIKKQLDDSYSKMYDKKCGDLKNAKVTPHSGNSGGGPVVKDDNNI